jgi:23S rRNA (uracil1939-C5)-methyltransferase
LPHLLPPPGKDRFTLYSLGSTLIAETGVSVAEDGKNRRQIPNRGTAALLGREITLEASSFFQSNAEALEKLLCRLRETAEKTAANTGKTGKMADLYAGAATLSLFLADLFPQGTDLVEADSGALELAKINLAKISQKGAFRFFPQKTDHWVQKRNLGGYDFIVADPPRQGLSPLLVRSLCQSGPPVFVYISCEAAAFARDYGSLAQYYNPESIFIFDFYPQTLHIETMAVFIRK